MNNMKMEIALPFKTVDGINNKLGCAQGLQASVWSFITALSDSMTRVQALLPNLS